MSFDFYRIREEVNPKTGVVKVFPDFLVRRSKDLMVRARSFYAVWDEKAGLWSTDEYDVQRLIDDELFAYAEELNRKEVSYELQLLGSFSSNRWLSFLNYVGHLSDSSHELDQNLTFSNTEVKKSDYVSRRLPYPLQEGPIDAYNEIMSSLYADDERDKLEWAIGSIVAGDARNIQKFVVLYGDPGTGKGTVIKIIQMLFDGYYTTFEAKAIAGSSNAFSTEVFKDNPLVAIQHDGDLSKIEDNTKLNSIISHEEMTVNEKYKPSYMTRINAFLFMGTNKPVKITDGKSGIIRRLIDVHPRGSKIPEDRYHTLMGQIPFELGAIAWHCLHRYREMGKNYYSGYRPVEMMLKTDIFFNFIEAHFDIFKSQGGVSLKQAYEMYKTFCDDTLVEFKLPQYKFREELKNYFSTYEDRAEVDGVRIRSYYSGFHADRFKVQTEPETHAFSLVMDETESLLDAELAAYPAQYANTSELPKKKWEKVTTTLADLDTSKLHYTKVPENHIVVDFDLTDATGNKSLQMNLEAASQWPSTYGEFSKGGGGVHLHYNYDGDASELARIYEPGIEIKVFTGDASLRRKLTLCNNVPIATINSGLPLREKSVINHEAVKTERALRDLIFRNLRKEIHPGTKPSVDFIHKILDDAYKSGLAYDVTDLRPKVLTFALGSTHQSETCVKLVSEMQFKSLEPSENKEIPDEKPIAFFDLEVFPNLFVICWKYEGDANVVSLVNPTPAEVEPLLGMRLIGFNNRKYDNHILYAAIMGYSVAELYTLSQRIIANSPNAMFSEAYGLSYADIYEYSSLKMSLKKFQIELGIHHMESPLPWDQPVPDEKIPQVIDYCSNDVVSTEKTHESRKADFVARQILAELSGLTVNDTTQKHTARIIFGNDKNPQSKFVYTDLSEMFPGYVYDFGKSTYRGELVGEGGYVYAEPGMYEDVALLDIASMHPTSIRELDAFGPEYTKKFYQLVEARLAIKHLDFESARKMLDGRLAPYLKDENTADALSFALKIVINIVYGMTSAKFDNPFKDPRNKDNIVAKRGALFMIELKHFIQSKGFAVAHIKTDSVKIPNATPEIIEAVMEFGDQYGYTFEHEATYERMCLVNDAVYIAKVAPGRKPGYWQATGAQFQHPYVFKTLFTHEPVTFDDLCETKSVTTALYLDFTSLERPAFMPAEEGPVFVGRVGQFVPIQEGKGGGLLVREKDGKFHSAGGAKGHFWLEAEMVRRLNKQSDIDMSYYEGLVYDAVQQLKKYGDSSWFTG